jgi:Fungal specific transcription factor domain
MDEHIWHQPAIPSEYPILPPSPISGVSSPWLTTSYSVPPLAVVNTIEPFQNPYHNISMPTIHALSPADSAPTKWDLLLDHGRSNMPTSTCSSPGPRAASAVPPVLLPSAGSATDDLLQNYKLTDVLTPAKQKTYFSAFWKYFHPLFPTIHCTQQLTLFPSLSSPHSAGYLLAFTMMAIGAQYSNQWSAPADSRITLEKCEESLVRAVASHASGSEMELELMQATVLAEYLSQFKAKRAPESLSETFRTVYDNVSFTST